MTYKKELEKETDENLLLLFTNSKNREALDALLERHMASAYHIANKYMRNQADAEDVVQKAFINVMRFAQTQKQPGMVKAWIMKTVINTSKNEIKHLIRQRKLLQEKPILQLTEDYSSSADKIELRKLLVSAIEQLPEHFRWPIWLTHYENMTIKEISHTLGKSENTIRTQISRGLEKLEQSLKAHESKIVSMNIGVLLCEYKNLDTVPPSLYNKIKTISSLKDSARISTVSLSKKFNIYWMITPIVILLTGYMGYFWLQKKKVKSSPNVEIISSNQIQNNPKQPMNIETQKPLNLFWDFNTSTLPSWCTVKNGNYLLLNEKAKNANCLKVIDKEDFLMNLKIPDNKNSFKVSFDAKILPIPNETFHIFSLTNISRKKGVTFAFNYNIEPGRINRVDIYVQKNLEAIYYNGSLMMVVIYPFIGDTLYNIHFRGAIVLLDNIEVKNLEEKQYKDFSKCIELSEKYLSQEGSHNIMIPSPMPEITSNQIEVYWGNKTDE